MTEIVDFPYTLNDLDTDGQRARWQSVANARPRNEPEC